MKPAIRVENLSKRYRVVTGPKGGTNATEMLSRAAKDTWRKVKTLADPTAMEEENTFWALKDVSFEVNPGEVVGVIGRNGAGKSTLLKILSRIVEPTGGRAEVRGRMGSLLEVGTGFHPELTGRENVYLNGAILGMSRREIAKKFDEIVAFAGIERFLDTPVKRYSSGMYVRLAFAVAAHLEPEILVVDEVLAVGDATFQKRCVDRMSEMARAGRTILFVSHNMQVVPLLCQRAVLLECGRVSLEGDSWSVTREYLTRQISLAKSGDLRDKPRTGSGCARFVRAYLVEGSGKRADCFTSGEDLTVRMEIESSVAFSDVGIAIVLATQHGTRIVTSWTKEAGFRASLRSGHQVIECRFRKVALRPGHTFLIHLWMSASEVLDSVENAIVIDVNRASGQRHLSPDGNQGAVVFDADWSAAAIENSVQHPAIR